MKSKLLMLGGADIQISAIVKAKELGYHVITCDYLPDNPGHKFSDEYHNVSTTDKEAVLQLSQRLGINGISAYASDPAAITAAYVSEKMKIPGNPFKSVELLSDKYTFRGVQKKLNIAHPAFYEVNNAAEVIAAAKQHRHGIILKPVDTSGSKGVYRISPHMPETKEPGFIQNVLEEGMGYSRMKRVIAEEYIVRKGFLMSGDFIIEQGEIIFMCFGDVHFNTRINGIVPRSISLPASNTAAFFEQVKKNLQAIVTSLNIVTGVFNADVIEDEQGRAVIIDIGARNGGNMFNDIIHYHSGVNLIDLSMKQCVGQHVQVKYNGEIHGYFAHNVLHTEKDGLFKGVAFSKEIEPLIIYRNINKKPGEPVHRFINSSFRIGLILLKFESFEQMHKILGHIHEHVRVELM